MNENFLDNTLKIKKVKLKKKKYKMSHLFILMIALYSIDFLTTVIALNLNHFEGKLYEVNPISAWFFSFGLIGWIGAVIFAFIIMFFMSFVITSLINHLKDEDYKFSLWIGVIFLFVVLESITIINNINLLLHNL